MSKLLHLCRLCGGLLVLALAGVSIMGCGGGTESSTGTPVGFTASLAVPAPVTEADLADAVVKPADGVVAVAAFTAPELSATGGLETGAGAPGTLDFDFAQGGGSLPMAWRNGVLFGTKRAVLPAGDAIVTLAPAHTFDMQGVTISSLTVHFTVHDGKPATWTLPSQMKLDLTRLKKHQYVLAGSFLRLAWPSVLALPPADGAVTLTANLYLNDTKVAGPLIKMATVSNGAVYFAGNNTVPFNRVDLDIDLRDAK